MMEHSTFIPNDGRMPALENLPTLLQKPIIQLKSIACVAGVTSGRQQDDVTTTLHIAFSDTEKMDYRKALDCFKVAGLATKAMQVNPLQRFMCIKLTHSKTLLD